LAIAIGDSVVRGGSIASILNQRFTARRRRVLVLRFQVVAVFLTAGTLVSPARQALTQGTPRALTTPPIVTATDAPAGTEALPVKWVSVAVPHLGVMRAGIARPSGTGPFPAVLVLHGTHGFARQYVEWANDLARGGFIAMAGCWFSGGGGAGVNEVTPPIPCPEIPPLKRDAYPEAVKYIDALVQTARALPGVRRDRIALVGHSRGGGEALQYLLAKGSVQAVVLHSTGHGYRPANRAAEFNVPILLLHGTADGPAGGGGVNTQVALTRAFEAALRRNHKPVEAHYYEGGGHNTFFTNPTQHDDELKRMIEFLRRHLGS
jgi:dienelactone hydrolase